MDVLRTELGVGRLATELDFWAPISGRLRLESRLEEKLGDKPRWYRANRGEFEGDVLELAHCESNEGL